MFPYLMTRIRAGKCRSVRQTPPGAIDGRTRTVNHLVGHFSRRTRDAALILVTSLLLVGQAGRAYGASEAASARSLHLVLQPASTLWLDGTSTLHPFTIHAKTITASAHVILEDGDDHADAKLRALREGTIENFELLVPVADLKSESAGLDKNLRKALKADKNANIRFQLATRSAKPNAQKPGAFEVEAHGALTIAGQTHDVRLVAEAQLTGSGLRIAGSKDLLMSDFGVKPPTMMFGTVKTGDKIVVHFNLLFATDATSPQ